SILSLRELRSSLVVFVNLRIAREHRLQVEIVQNLLKLRCGQSVARLDFSPIGFRARVRDQSLALVFETKHIRSVFSTWLSEAPDALTPPGSGVRRVFFRRGVSALERLTESVAEETLE